jgi:hypothetical integral membrane protein (TIGR02206 family)
MEIFARDFTGGPFVMLGTPHLVVLVVLLAVNLSLLRLRRASQRARDTFRIVLGIVLLVNEIAWHVWNAAVGMWTLQTMVPLHLCSVLIWVSSYMLLTNSTRAYEFVYFLGIGAGVQAVMTPDLGIYGFPHFRFFQTFISHGGIITAAVYMTLVQNQRPYLASIGRVIIGGLAYMVIVFGINSLLGSNYLFIMRKPDTPSLIDLLGPWPIYILGLFAIALVEFAILYLPFFLKDRLQSVPGQASSAGD